MTDAAACGCSPLEIIRVPDNGGRGIGGAAGKPPGRFEFGRNSRPVFKTGAAGSEILPGNRFLIARRRPGYANPYGVKVFLKRCRLAAFKKNGFRRRTVSAEKYGGAFLYGKYPAGEGGRFKQELLDAPGAAVA
jgi:hypothetical protein